MRLRILREVFSDFVFTNGQKIYPENSKLYVSLCNICICIYIIDTPPSYALITPYKSVIEREKK